MGITDTHKDHHQVGVRNTEEWKSRGPVTLILIVTEGRDQCPEWTAMEHIWILQFFPMKGQISWVLIHQFFSRRLFSNCESCRSIPSAPCRKPSSSILSILWSYCNCSRIQTDGCVSPRTQAEHRCCIFSFKYGAPYTRYLL
jgi:hypothetical protein